MCVELISPPRTAWRGLEDLTAIQLRAICLFVCSYETAISERCFIFYISGFIGKVSKMIWECLRPAIPTWRDNKKIVEKFGRAGP